MKKLGLIGEKIYEKFGVLPFFNRRVGPLLLKLVGIRQYAQAMQLYWGKVYSCHLYVSVGVLILSSSRPLSTGVVYFLLGNVLCQYYFYAQLKEQVRIHQHKVIEGFYEFSTLYTLMINAGLNHRNALEECVDCQGFSPYVRTAVQRIASGVSEAAALEEISSACREPVITRYIGCILQGQRHGNKKLREDLKRITAENWQEKLNHHRKSGEILKTKLLFPAMMIFVGILLILMLPVTIQFQQLT